MKKQAERNKKIAEQYRQHGDVKRLAQEFALAIAAIRTILRNNGISIHEENKKRKMSRMKAAVKSYKSGKEIREIAGELNLPENTVWLLLTERGIFKPNRIAKERDKKILADIKKGMPFADIAQRYHVFTSYISYLGTKHGIYKQHELRDKILNMLKHEQDKTKVAAKLGTTRKYVSRIYMNSRKKKG